MGELVGGELNVFAIGVIEEARQRTGIPNRFVYRNGNGNSRLAKFVSKIEHLEES